MEYYNMDLLQHLHIFSLLALSIIKCFCEKRALIKVLEKEDMFLTDTFIKVHYSNM